MLNSKRITSRSIKVAFAVAIASSTAFAAVTLGSLKISGNEIQSTATNGNIVLNPNGTGGVNFVDQTASRAAYFDASKNLISSTVTSTELGYVAGVTSAIQTQIDGKQERSTLTTKGDLYCATASSTVARIGVGSNNQVLTADSAQSCGVKWANPGAPTAPKITRYTSGSGTFNITGSPVYIVVEVVGGGGGGGGSGTATGTSATAGTASTFGTSLITANGGDAGAYSSDGNAGGTFTVNSPAVDIGSVIGGDSGGGNATAPSGIYLAGGMGGGSGLGGSTRTNRKAAGVAGAANTGWGGSGGGSTGAANFNCGSGGGGGAKALAMIVSPSSSYSYSVGAGGTGGGTGTSGYAGGAGGSGRITITEHYQ